MKIEKFEKGTNFFSTVCKFFSLPTVGVRCGKAIFWKPPRRSNVFVSFSYLIVVIILDETTFYYCISHYFIKMRRKICRMAEVNMPNKSDHQFSALMKHTSVLELGALPWDVDMVCILFYTFTFPCFVYSFIYAEEWCIRLDVE